MITISAFADEIDADLDVQMYICKKNGIKCIDVRGIDGRNVSSFTVAEAKEYRRRMEDGGFTVPCIGSPIGKIRMDEDFDAHLELLKNCCDVAGAFGTDRVRIFSFYASRGADIADEREAVMDRMRAMVAVAESAGVTLYHENESNIYGALPDGVKDLFATVRSPHLKGIFDPANFVVEGIRPYDEAWKAGLAELTDYFHIKDKRPQEKACCPAGQGAGQIEQIFADLKERAWSGYMTLEPHMAVAGQFSGFTGPELFTKAVDGLKRLLDKLDMPYE